MARAKQTEYAYFDDGDIALYHRPGTKAYQARIKLEGGKSLVRSTGTENLQEALKWARREKIANETKIELGLDPTGRTFKYVAERWLGSLDAKKERQVRDYTRIVTRYLIPYFGAMKITQITQRAISEYEDWRKAYWLTGPGAQESQETIERADGITYTRKKTFGARGKADAEDTVLRQIFKYAISQDMLEGSRMPMIGGKANGKTKFKGHARPAFTRDQAERILQHCMDMALPEGNDLKVPDPDRMVFAAWVHIMLGTGIRPGKECQQILWKHFRNETVNGEDHTFLTIMKDTKTGERTVWCDPFVWRFLVTFRIYSDFKGDNDFVLADQKTGKAVLDFKRQFATMMAALDMEVDDHGNPYVPYSFRHTWATLKLNEGMNERLVALNMGTSPEMIHKHYGKDDTISRAGEFKSPLDFFAFKPAWLETE
ncbi:tyrosine-type recombinase/integrase [Phaeospirillum tilakii]|uniref:Tyrosine-type recombinase/integrase n=1 Tax=Phaeospirillum tilakii TaxID=741673 RepID=A0ABW5CFF7_9PROT